MEMDEGGWWWGGVKPCCAVSVTVIYSQELYSMTFLAKILSNLF